MHCAIFLVFLGAAFGANNHGTPSQTEVDNAFETLGVHYNDKLCLELLLVDCSNHVTVHDELLCGSNGKTYPDHCHFTHAVCEFLNGKNQLTLAHTGACLATTTAPATSAPASTSGVAMTTMAPSATTMAASATMTTLASGGVTSTMAPAGSTMAPAGSTMAPAGTTTMGAVVTSTAAQTVTATTDPLAAIIQNVFCQSASTVTCATALEIKCGSDGQLYPNQCELAKAKCADPTLMLADMSTCVSG